jgi:hypothetical protein
MRNFQFLGGLFQTAFFLVCQRQIYAHWKISGVPSQRCAVLPDCVVETFLMRIGGGQIDTHCNRFGMRFEELLVYARRGQIIAALLRRYRPLEQLLRIAGLRA